MRREAMNAERRRARDTRAVIAGLLGLSVLANLVLGYGIAHRERVTVLVPAVAGPAWEVGESWAGRRYLEDAARTAAVTLLTVTPENAAQLREAGAPALALTVTAAFMLTDASPDWIQAVCLASVVQTVSASFLQTLWKGLNHGDWSAFT